MADHAYSTPTPPTTTPHGLTAAQMTERALTIAFTHLSAYMTFTATTKAEQRLARVMLSGFEIAGQRIQNEAADQHNVYRLRRASNGQWSHLPPGPAMDAERLAIYEIGRAIANAAHEADNGR
jgi:hypothetical protein